MVIKQPLKGHSTFHSFLNVPDEVIRLGTEARRAGARRRWDYEIMTDDNVAMYWLITF